MELYTTDTRLYGWDKSTNSQCYRINTVGSNSLCFKAMTLIDFNWTFLRQGLKAKICQKYTSLKVRQACTNVPVIPELINTWLLSAGDRPVPQGNSRIKRSPEQLIGQRGLSKLCTKTHAVSTGINSFLGWKHLSLLCELIQGTTNHEIRHETLLVCSTRQ